MSKLYTLKYVQNIPSSIDEVWKFISSPKNLKDITPPYMGFDIMSDYKDEIMYEGMIIKYKVSPISGLKLNWVTEITHIKDKSYFVDEQRFGPYSFWHHQHHLKSIERGVEMTDIINYKVPLLFIGDIINKLKIEKQLNEIFTYRYNKIEEIFGKYKTI